LDAYRDLIYSSCGLIDSSCGLTDESRDLIDASRGLIVASRGLTDVSHGLIDESCGLIVASRGLIGVFRGLIEASCDLLASSCLFPILTPPWQMSRRVFSLNISFYQYHKDQYSQILVNHQNQSGHQKFVKSSRFNESSGSRVFRCVSNFKRIPSTF
jgi:hypothetical protein